MPGFPQPRTYSLLPSMSRAHLVLHVGSQLNGFTLAAETDQSRLETWQSLLENANFGQDVISGVMHIMETFYHDLPDNGYVRLLQRGVNRYFADGFRVVGGRNTPDDPIRIELKGVDIPLYSPAHRLIRLDGMNTDWCAGPSPAQYALRSGPHETRTEGVEKFSRGELSRTGKACEIEVDNRDTWTYVSLPAFPVLGSMSRRPVTLREAAAVWNVHFPRLVRTGEMRNLPVYAQLHFLRETDWEELEEARRRAAYVPSAR
ncbi:hypothetical protein JCM8547_005559 [Rhodosporidiobolus lusitaniae]